MRDPVEELRSFDSLDPLHPALPASEVRRLGDRRRRRTTALMAAAAATAVAAIAVPTALLAAGPDRTVPLPPATQTPTSTADPTPSETRSADPAANWLTLVPADFPLAAGLPEADGAESTLTGPERTDQPVDFEVCGAPLSVGEPADLLRVAYQAPEDYRVRQLATYPDSGAADDALAAVVDTYRACPEEPAGDDGYLTRYEVRAAAAGDEAWAILARDSMEREETPFGATSLWVRVANAVLLLDAGGHAGDPNGDGQDQVDEMLAEAAEPIAAMCVFTPDGCGAAREAEGEVITDAFTGPLLSGLPPGEVSTSELHKRSFGFCGRLIWTGDGAVGGVSGAITNGDGTVFERHVAVYGSRAEAQERFEAIASELDRCSPSGDVEIVGGYRGRIATTDPSVAWAVIYRDHVIGAGGRTGNVVSTVTLSGRSLVLHDVEVLDFENETSVVERTLTNAREFVDAARRL